MRACSKPASLRSWEARTNTPGAALDGGAEGGEVAAGFGGHEEHGLLGFIGDCNENAFFADLFFPGVDAEEPAVGRGVGGAARKTQMSR